jgi:mannosylfructose-6-phosphate phosphatase
VTPVAVVCDVDGTLLGDDDALDEFVRWIEPQRDRLRLVYNSGRFVDSVRESIDLTALPQPDAIIGGVGTEILLTGTDRRLDDWPAAPKWNSLTVGELVASFPNAVPQPDEFQSRWKRSFHWHDASDEDLQSLAAALTAAGLDHQVVYSSRRDLDVLPAGVDKGSAARRLMRHWDLPECNVIVAGDSGNDLAMYSCGFCGVTVGNAHEPLRRLNGDRVFHADRPYAAGVLDGLKHWLPRLVEATAGRLG